LRADPIFLIAQLLVFVKIAVLLVVFDPAAADAFSLPKSTASHAVTYLLLVTLAYLIARHPAAVLRYSSAHLAAAAVLLLFALATPFAISPTIAAFGASRRYLGLSQMADNLVLYGAAVVLFPTLRDLARLLAATAVAVVPVVAYAVVQRAGLDPITYAASTISRASSTLGQPDIAGGYLSIAASTLIAVVSFRWARLPAIARAALAILAVAALVALYFTGSRAGILGLMAGAIGIAAIALFSGSVSRRTLAISGLVAVVISLALIAITPVGDRLRPSALRTDQSLLSRVEIWDTAMRAVAQRPLLGLGPDNFVAAYPALRSEQSYVISPGVLENSTHNWFLYALTSAGPFAALALVTLIAFALAAAVGFAQARDPRALLAVPLLAYLGEGVVNVNDLGLDWVLWMSIGCLISGVARPLTRRPRAASYSSAGAVAFVLLLAAVYGVTASRGRLLASEYYAREESMSTAAQGLAAVEAGRQAIAIDPGRSEYWSGFGRALLLAGNPGAAAQGFQEATTRDPWQPQYWRNLALARLSNADSRGASDALHKAVAADPYDAESHSLLARLSYNAGDYMQALAEGKIMVRLMPGKVDEYEAPFRAALALNKLQDDADLLEFGVAHTDSNALRDELAQIYDALGQRERALALVRDVLARDPSDGVALQLLETYTKR